MTRPARPETRADDWKQRFDAATDGAGQLRIANSYLLAQIARVAQVRPADAEAMRRHAATQIFTLAASLTQRTRTRGGDQ